MKPLAKTELEPPRQQDGDFLNNATAVGAGRHETNALASIIPMNRQRIPFQPEVHRTEKRRTIYKDLVWVQCEEYMNYLAGNLRSRWLRLVSLLFAAVALLTGCVTPTAKVEAIRDPYYVLTPQSRIAVLIDQDGSVQEKQLGNFLVGQLQTNGFNIVSGPDSEFTLVYGTTENSTTTAFWLNAYTTADFGGEKTKIVWKGYISAGAIDFRKDRDRVVRTLLSYFGQEFKGSVTLVRKP